VRPSDENQHGSTRPNLLSGTRRHLDGDDNILERLERDSARHASGNRSRAAWYAAAASLMLLLVVALAWTAYDNASTVHLVPVTRLPADSGAAAPMARSEQDGQPITGTALPVPRPSAPVVSQDSAVAPLPPLVLLPGHEVASAKTPAPPRPAELAAAVPAAARPATRVSPAPAPAAAGARPAPRPVAVVQQPKPGPGSLHADAGVDTDVALLSAIIIHDSAHAEEKAQLEAAAACLRTGARKCAGRPGNGQVLAN